MQKDDKGGLMVVAVRACIHVVAVVLTADSSNKKDNGDFRMTRKEGEVMLVDVEDDDKSFHRRDVDNADRPQ